MSAGTDAPNAFGPLVTAEQLRDQLRAPDLRVVDLRWYLARDRRGADEYARGHIPGAVFLDLERELTAPAGPGRHPIPSPRQFEQAMRGAGVSPDTRVVVYDDAGGSVAARLWWLLRYYGHAHVAVLDGGIQAWQAAGGALATDAVWHAPGSFAARFPTAARSVVDKHHVDATRSEPGVLILDARTPERYHGAVEPIDARPGHIPGATNAPWPENLAPDGRFKTPDLLRTRYAALGAAAARELIVYCGSGVTACHDLLALELAGVRGARLYEGSWSDWSRDPGLPAARSDKATPGLGR